MILVPSPNVAEDHQTKNALALSTKNAAIHVKDADAPANLLELAVHTVNDDKRLKELSDYSPTMFSEEAFGNEEENRR